MAGESDNRGLRTGHGDAFDVLPLAAPVDAGDNRPAILTGPKARPLTTWPKEGAMQPAGLCATQWADGTQRAGWKRMKDGL